MWGEWRYCFGLVVAPVLCFKARVNSLRFTPGATPADLLMTGMAAELYGSMYNHWWDLNPFMKYTYFKMAYCLFCSSISMSVWNELHSMVYLMIIQQLVYRFYLCLIWLRFIFYLNRFHTIKINFLIFLLIIFLNH